MKFNIVFSNPKVVATIEIESYQDFMMARSDFFLKLPDEIAHLRRDFFWYTIANMECDLRAVLVVFNGKDVDVKFKMQKSWLVEASKMEKDIQEALCGLLSNGMIEMIN